MMQERAQGSATATGVAATPQPLEVDVPECPALAPNVRLVGELQGTGFRDRQWLMMRDGRFLQVTELLYRVAEQADGERTLAEIAAGVTEATECLVGPDQVRHLMRTLLIPRGLIAMPEATPGGSRLSTGGTAGQQQLASPLALSLRLRVLGPDAINPIANALQVFFAPPVLVLALIAVAAAHWWLYVVHGLAGSLHAALFTPGGLLVVLALLCAADAFHEFGHASALRYGGGRTRGIGAGIYLIYPVFYTDVTDSYRLGRRARVRTDLGGFYFHLIFALGMVALFLVSRQEILLFTVPLIDLAILRQCLPFVRLDGYWVLADLTGVPDFFTQIGPFMRSLMPASAVKGSRMPPLKSWAKAVFAGYVAFTIPLLALLLFLMVKGLPLLITTTWDALVYQAHLFSRAWSALDELSVLSSLVQTFFLVLPMVGVAYIVVRMGRRLLTGLWSWARPSARRRVAGTFVALGVAVLLASMWLPQLGDVRASPPAGVQTFQVTSRAHIQSHFVYPQNPPVGGPHWPVWQDCGFYDAPVFNEQAVHSMEHGAVWITYRPDLARDQVDALRVLARSQTYVLVSPYPGLPAPVVASAWGHQLRLSSAFDPQLRQFVRAFREGPQTPERGSPCTGGSGTPS